MAERIRTIGLSLGADICWPICYEELVRRLDLAIPYDGDTLRFHVERVTIEPFDLRQPSRYDVVIDRLTHWYHTSREWIKKAILLNGLYVFNNPWSLQSNEKHTTYCAMMRLGLPVPDTWLIPPKAYKHSADLQPTLERYARYFDLGEIGRKIGFPVFMKPYDGGAWVGVSKIDDEQELWRAYEHSGTLIMNLQAGVVPYDYFVRCIGLGPQTRCVNYDPAAPFTIAICSTPTSSAQDDRSVLEDMTLTINAFFGWDFNSCEALRKDGIWHPIDFANACPDSQVTSLHLHFPWLIKANIRWSLFCAATKRRMRPNLDWQPFFEIAGRRPAISRAAARLRPRSRTSASRPIGSRSSAPSISRISTRSPTSSSARRSRGMRCIRRSRRCSRRTRSTSSPSYSGAASRRGGTRRAAAREGGVALVVAASGMRGDGRPLGALGDAGAAVPHRRRRCGGGRADGVIGGASVPDRGRPDQGLFLRQRRRAGLGLEATFLGLLRVPAEPLRRVRRRGGGAGDPDRCRSDDRDRGRRRLDRRVQRRGSLCRHPDVFHAAIALSGTYDLEKLFGFQGDENFYFASPLVFVLNLPEGGSSSICDGASCSSRLARGAGRTPASPGAWPTCSAARGFPTAWIPGAMNGITTGRPGGRCCLTISAS